jgi:arginyl-tRNA synthetase
MQCSAITFVRVLKRAGERVEVQNYIDNTGVQVADVVSWISSYREAEPGPDQSRLDASLSKIIRFDYYCWDLYTRVGLFYRDGHASAR